MDLVLTNIHKYTPKRSDWAVDVDVDVEAGADVDVDDDDDDDEDDDDECVTCERLLIVSVVALVADIVSGIIDVATFSWVFESPFEPTRRIISGVEKRAGPNESTMYAGDLRVSFFGCFFAAEN